MDLINVDYYINTKPLSLFFPPFSLFSSNASSTTSSTTTPTTAPGIQSMFQQMQSNPQLSANMTQSPFFQQAMQQMMSNPQLMQSVLFFTLKADFHYARLWSNTYSKTKESKHAFRIARKNLPSGNPP